MTGLNVLIWGNTETRRESDGRRGVATNALEDARIARTARELERLLVDELGRDELLAAGHPQHEIELELSVRAADLTP